MKAPLQPAAARGPSWRSGCLALILLLTSCERPPAPLAPLVAPVEGTLAVEGLSAPVRVVRDRWGVPHIRAASQDDLFFAQGFVQAQDRLFQMDLWRRSVQGRLAEVLGANFVQRDVMTRRVQYRGDLEAEWASYGPDTREIATAFVGGINAWVSRARIRPPEEFILAGWSPEYWRAEDLLNRTEAFVASGNALDEVFRARLASTVGLATANRILPPAGGRSSAAPGGLDLDVVSPLVGDAIRRVGTEPFFLSLAGVPETPQGFEGSRGSNAWAVAPHRSASGAALLAFDPHVWLSHPSLRYLVHLEAPGWHVAGATAPWRPGVVMGHNERIAWGVAAASLDTQDIYVERVNPDNPRQTWADGRWVDSIVETDTILVRGRTEPVSDERQITPHGVVVTVDPERALAYTVRWSGAEPGTAPELAALAIDRAGTWPEFLAAVARWKLPTAEFVYADVDGRVGRQTAGLVPIRQQTSGDLPVPGWTGDYEWRGWTALDQLPRLVDPSSGWVVAANGNLARTRRLDEQLSAGGALAARDLVSLQRDTRAWNAGQLVPLLGRLTADRQEVEAARIRLLAWDGTMTPAGEDAALYLRWEQALVDRLVRRRVPDQLVAEAAARLRPILVPPIRSPSATWFDAPAEEERNKLLLGALEDSVRSGRALDEVTFTHPLAITDALRTRYNAGPLVLGGYDQTIFAVRRLGDRAIGPALQLVADLGDWDRVLVAAAPGQSGSPESPHLRDLVSPWAAGEYFPLAFSEEAVQANAVTTLTLTPLTVTPRAESRGAPTDRHVQAAADRRRGWRHLTLWQ